MVCARTEEGMGVKCGALVYCACEYVHVSLYICIDMYRMGWMSACENVCSCWVCECRHECVLVCECGCGYVNVRT